MKRTLRIREKKLDVELTLWKMIPLFFLIMLFIISATIIGGSAIGGAAPPQFE